MTEQPRIEDYAKPMIEDYGDVADVTALNATGLRTDATIPVGQIPTFSLS